MGSDRYGINPTDEKMGRAWANGIDSYTTAFPDVHEYEIAERIGVTRARLSNMKDGKEVTYARHIKAAAMSGIWEPLLSLNEQCGCVTTILPRESVARTISPSDAMAMLKECTEAASAVIDGIADGKFTEGEKIDALRELGEAQVKIALVTRMVAEARTTKERM